MSAQTSRHLACPRQGNPPTTAARKAHGTHAVSRATEREEHSDGEPRRRQGQFRKKVVASSVVLAAGAALLSGGVYAGWTSQAAVDQGVGAVDLTAGFIETGGGDHLFDEIANAFPGDYWTRYGTLANGGSIDQEFSVRVDTAADSLTAELDGLRAAISTCTVAFSAEGTCTAGAVEVLADGFITDAGRSGTNVLVAQGQSLYFKIVYTLDAEADQATFEGQQDTAVVEVSSLTAARAGEDRTSA